jgi:nucleoside-diphosphate-sugar epimerase
MKTVILAGGLGSRLGEETNLRPKPMVEVGGKPIIWHIMKIYSAHGLNDFVICLGYKGYMIKQYFSNYFLHMSDATIDLTKNYEGWNFALALEDATSVRWVADNLARIWGEGGAWDKAGEPQPHEAAHLSRDCAKARARLDWTRAWGLREGLSRAGALYKEFANGANVAELTLG